MITQIFLLLLLYQIKHYLADYPLQGAYMLGKFLPGWQFLKPLSAHCAVHAWFTFVIAAVFLAQVHGPGYGLLPFWLAAFDFGVHFVMDRIKAGPNWLGRFKALSGTEYMALARENAQLDVDVHTGPQSNEQIYKWAVRKGEIMSRFKSNVYFWWSLGVDQMVHHLTHYAIIYWLVTS